VNSLFDSKSLQSVVTGGKSLMQSGVNAGRSLFGKLGGGFGTPQMQPAYAGGNPSAFLTFPVIFSRNASIRSIDD
jgi:hypothetical protein